MTGSGRLDYAVRCPARRLRPTEIATPAGVPARTARHTHHATEEGEVADRKRRREDDAEDRLEDEAFDDDALDDDDAFDDAVDDDAEDEEPVSRRGGTATRARKKAETADRSAQEKKDAVKVKRDTERVGPFGWIARFVREVIAEMRKVIWPTRKELVTYTAVVVVFVAAVTAIVAGLDYVFAKGVLWVFGNPK